MVTERTAILCPQMGGREQEVGLRYKNLKACHHRVISHREVPLPAGSPALPKEHPSAGIKSSHP